MRKIIKDLQEGDKLYFFFRDKIDEYTVKGTEPAREKRFGTSFYDEPKEEFVFKIACKEFSLPLTLYSGQWYNDWYSTNVATDEGYTFGIYATSIKKIKEVLEMRYNYALKEKEMVIKHADEAIAQAREQLKNFDQTISNESK